MRDSRTSSRRAHPTALVLGVLVAFLIGTVALVALSLGDNGTTRAKRIVVTSTMPPVTSTTLGVTQYTVQPGDTLVAIAERLGVSESVILEANELPNPDVLVAGQVLKIPPPRVLVLVVKPATIHVGEVIRIKLTGAQANEQVTFEISSPAEQFTGPAHAATKGGKVITSYQVELDDVPGTYTVIARGDDVTTVQATFVVEPIA